MDEGGDMCEKMGFKIETTPCNLLCLKINHVVVLVVVDTLGEQKISWSRTTAPKSALARV